METNEILEVKKPEADRQKDTETHRERERERERKREKDREREKGEREVVTLWSELTVLEGKFQGDSERE